MTDTEHAAHDVGFASTAEWVRSLGTRLLAANQERARLEAENARLTHLINTHTEHCTDAIREPK